MSLLRKMKKDLLKINAPTREQEVCRALQTIFHDMQVGLTDKEAFKILGWEYETKEELFSIYDKDKITVTDISENRHKVFTDKASVSFTDTSYAGLYSIENGQQKTYFNVRFPEEESVVYKDIKVSKSGDDSKQAGNKALRGLSKKQFTRPILFVVLIVMLLEWRIYRKRL